MFKRHQLLKYISSTRKKSPAELTPDVKNKKIWESLKNSVKPLLTNRFEFEENVRLPHPETSFCININRKVNRLKYQSSYPSWFYGDPLFKDPKCAILREDTKFSSYMTNIYESIYQVFRLIYRTPVESSPYEYFPFINPRMWERCFEKTKNHLKKIQSGNQSKHMIDFNNYNSIELYHFNKFLENHEYKLENINRGPIQVHKDVPSPCRPIYGVFKDQYLDLHQTYRDHERRIKLSFIRSLPAWARSGWFQEESSIPRLLNVLSFPVLIGGVFVHLIPFFCGAGSPFAIALSRDVISLTTVYGVCALTCFSQLHHILQHTKSFDNPRYRDLWQRTRGFRYTSALFSLCTVFIVLFYQHFFLHEAVEACIGQILAVWCLDYIAALYCHMPQFLFYDRIRFSLVFLIGYVLLLFSEGIGYNLPKPKYSF